MTKDWYAALFLACGIIIGFAVCRWMTKPCPEPRPIVDVIVDSTLAISYKQQADYYKSKADSLARVRSRVRRDTVWVFMQSAPMPVVDSIIEANR